MQLSDNDEIGSLESARERLYSRQNRTEPFAPRVSMRPAKPTSAWDKISFSGNAHRERWPKFAAIFFSASFAFFVVAAGVAAFLLYSGGNSVSVGKILIDVNGPTAIAAGDVSTFLVTITNTNTVAINDATLRVDFPEETKKADDRSVPYTQYMENIGSLASGASITKSIRATFFGSAGDTLSLPISVSYGTDTSNSTFVKSDTYQFEISSAPLSISIEAPHEVSVNSPFTITLTVHSQAQAPIGNVVVSNAFPFGFVASDSSLPINDGSIVIGTLSPDERKTITITGSVVGQESGQRVFRFTIGTAANDGGSSISVAYMTQEASITMAAPFINTVLSFNGNSSETVVLAPGKQQNVAVSYTNTLPTSVSDVVVSVAISGSAVDYDSINTSRGFYRSSDHTIVFSKETDPTLSSLPPGASGIGAFNFSTFSAMSAISAPTAAFSISASGLPTDRTYGGEGLASSKTRTVKVATEVSLSVETLYDIGSISNAGPIPPRVDQPTTYTILMKARNPGSSVAGGTVSVSLPGYVSYTGLKNGSVSYDSVSRAVSWNVGDLVQGASAQGAFQISLTPSLSQKGSAPVLAGRASFSGYDRFAGVSVSASAEPVTTQTINGLGHANEQAIVQ